MCRGHRAPRQPKRYARSGWPTVAGAGNRGSEERSGAPDQGAGEPAAAPSGGRSDAGQAPCAAGSPGKLPSRAPVSSRSRRPRGSPGAAPAGRPVGIARDSASRGAERTKRLSPPIRSRWPVNMAAMAVARSRPSRDAEWPVNDKRREQIRRHEGRNAPARQCKRGRPRPSTLARIIHRGTVWLRDTEVQGAIFRGIGDAGDRGLRLRREVCFGASDPVVYGGNLAIRLARLAKPAW
jgi:hypothetical protein